MSGGLRHGNDDEPAEPCGWISIIERRGTAPYALPGNVCPNLQKPKANSLDTSDVVRDVVNRWDEKAGLRTGCGVRSQVIDVLKAQIKRRPAMKKTSTVAAKQSRNFSQPKLT